MKYFEKLALVLVAVVMMLSAIPVHAQGLTQSNEAEIVNASQPPLPTANVFESERTPVGSLTPEEVADLLAFEERARNPLFSYSVRITSTRRGQTSRGVQAETTARVNRYSTLSLNRSLGVSNSFNTSLGASSIISANVGFSVTHSSSSTASYSVSLRPNDMASITVYDMFDVSYLAITRTNMLTFSRQTGDGWAAQWTNFGFSARVW